MGDLSVAPTINDVWDDSFNPQRRKWPGCKPWERHLFQNLRNRTSLIDGYLHFAGGEEKGSRYTFWRKAQDRQEKKGWRLDVAMLDPALVDPDAKAMGLPYVQGVKHYQHIHGSDHCPIGFVYGT